jgi:hypothetical protein
MKFSLAGNLLRFCDFHKEIEVPATSVQDGLLQLVESHPALRLVLFDGAGHVRGVHRMYLNGEMLPRNDLERPVGVADELLILTPLAGG